MPNFKLAGKWKELFKDPSESFYNSEMNIQDEKIKKENQQPINQIYNPSITSGEQTPIPSSTIDTLRSLLEPQIPTPVVNTFLQNKTAQQYSTDQQELQYAAPIDLIGKAARRLVTLGKQQVDNVPGLNAIATGQEDETPNLTGALIQAGGRFLPLAGIAIQTLNAGPTRAGTLDEARRLGWLK
jgi:hypothetical protein